jgi:hypothetical protein
MDILDESCEMAPQINHDKVILKPHQLTLLHKCFDFENNIQKFQGTEFQTSIGIIGDKVGSGKSFLVLSLIYTSLNKPIPNIGNIRLLGIDKIVVKSNSNFKIIDTNLLIIPHNLMHQWKQSCDIFRYLKCFFISMNSHVNLIDDIKNYDLVVVSSTIYKEFYNKYSIYQFKRTFIDEADNINIPNFPQPFSNFTWLVTASYNNLVYPKGHIEWNNQIQKYIVHSVGLRNKGYLYNLFLDLSTKMPNLIQKIIIKNKDEFVDRSFQLPDIIVNKIVCRSSHLINILNGVVNPEIIACLNAEDISTAISLANLSLKESEDNIINAIISKYIRLIKNLELNIEYVNKLEYDEESVKEKELSGLLTQKTNFEFKINNIKQRIKETDVCNICFEEINNKTITNCCQNSFCFKCLTKWINIKTSCPCCNQNLSMNEFFLVTEDKCDSTSQNKEIKLSDSNDKITNLKILLQSLKNKKLLIFSAYNESFKPISHILKSINLKYETIKGSSNHIKNIVNKYKHEDLNALLVNSTNYGNGLNLENTTDIIIFHQFNEECTKQVIGRAQRTGRKESLNIWYLLNENEVRLI